MIYMVLMICFIVISLGIAGFEAFRVVKIIKNLSPKTIDYPLENRKFLFGLIATSISVTMLFMFLALFQTYPLQALEWVLLVLGSALFGFFFPNAVICFVLHYYAKELDDKMKSFYFKSMLVSFAGICFGLLALTTAIADYIPYPLVNGISFSEEPFHTPAMSGSPNLTWYALCIVSGAVLCYLICDHRFYKEYGKHGILESTFLISFPSGIIGARLGYVLGEWNHGPNSFADRVANGQWWAPFAIWEGGLTVISGALIGIIVGVLWFIWRNKKYSIWLAVDVVVPTILVAQAVGRWGNFFNCEVHGLQVARDSLSWFIPKIVLNNAQYSDAHGFASSGNVWLPLFYIESIANLFGYFVIRFLIGKLLRKYVELGDLCFLYISWYGMTRVLLEPLRDTTYNMGNDGYWSWFWSIVFVLGGFLLIALNHIIRAIIANKKGTFVRLKDGFKNGLIASIAFLVVGLALLIVGIILMINGTPATTIAFNTFNNGIIVLVWGLSILSLLAFSLPHVLLAKHRLEKDTNEKQIEEKEGTNE